MATRAMLAAVSGVDADQTYLDEVANNIANADTIGYEQGTVEFGDLLAEQITGATAPTTGSGGVDPVAVGSGVRVASVITDTTEGTLEATGDTTDVAITGNGFLVVDDGGQQLYTRDGALTRDASGQLTTDSGAIVEGWEATANGTIDSNAPVGAITIPTGETIPAKMTTAITLEGNLPMWNGVAGTAPTPPPTLTVDTYTPLGTIVPLIITFTPVATTASTWTVSVTSTGSTTTLLTGGPETITFTTGRLTATGLPVTTANGNSFMTIKAPGTDGFPATTAMKLFFPKSTSAGAVTQFTGSQTIGQTANGYAAGSLESYSISSSGVITGSFSNGRTLALGQIALASFANPAGLSNLGNGLLAASANSGQAQVGTAGTGIRGSIVGGELEDSNVDLGTQLTDLITAQEAYEANTKSISTSQEVIASLEQV